MSDPFTVASGLNPGLVLMSVDAAGNLSILGGITATGQGWTVSAAGVFQWGPAGNALFDTDLYRQAAAQLATDGDFLIRTAGRGLQVKEGANAKMGSVALVAGAATVATTAVTANSRILVTSQVDGGAPGFLRVSARVAGTSFTITSSSGTDTSTVAWFIVEPSA